MKRTIKRILAYTWASPTTVVGIFWGGVSLATGGKTQLRRGVIEFHGGFADTYLKRAGFSAITLGHVILGRDAQALDRCRDHEHVHVRQVERWGPLFIPAYLAASAWTWMRGGRAYRDNPFEIEAYENS